jgi:hypothetical protein
VSAVRTGHLSGHEAAHHRLLGPGQHQDYIPPGSDLIPPALDQRRQRGVRIDQVRELIEDQADPSMHRRLGHDREQFVPVAKREPRRSTPTKPGRERTNDPTQVGELIALELLGRHVVCDGLPAGEPDQQLALPNSASPM